jgi:uncharacterized cupin superfamily protein
MNEKTPEYHLATAAQIRAEPDVPIAHPLNPKSEVYLKRLSVKVGLQREQVYLSRIPPGKESFAYHAHKGDEEWLFILSGRGRALIGDKTFEVGPGDFMGFPTPSIGHHLTNPYGEDLVYLMGGERGRADIVSFPTFGKVGLFGADGVNFVDADKLQPMSLQDFVKKSD